jgi:long-subunit acyl-CoA synthetase (AMP-forming)
LNKLVFKNIAAIFGGNIQVIFCGSSTLNLNVQQFIHVCVAPVRQAYALTETCAGGSIQYDFETAETNIVGSLMEHCQMRLVDWNEGLSSNFEAFIRDRRASYRVFS